MPKITIDLPADVNEKLKLKAKADYRSLTNYITVALINLANEEEKITTVTLDQLQTQGVENIKFTHAHAHTQNENKAPLTPEEKHLKELKMQQQFENLKQKRIVFLKKSSKDILGCVLPCVESNDTATINYILEKYPSDDDIVEYLNKLKQLIEENDFGILYHPVYLGTIEGKFEPNLIMPIETNSIYKKIKACAIAECLTDDLYHLLKYPTFEYNAVPEDIENRLLRPALGVPPYPTYMYNDDEIEELKQSLSWLE